MLKVLAIDTGAKEVHTSKGNTFSYDILVLATGSAAGLPPYVTPEKAKDTKGEYLLALRCTYCVLTR